jgi:hypothetical protein
VPTRSGLGSSGANGAPSTELPIQLMRPLWWLSRKPYLSTVRGHAEVVAECLKDGWVGAVTGWYSIDKANAPDRPEKLKKYVAGLRSGRPTGRQKEPVSPALPLQQRLKKRMQRTEEHLMMAMYNAGELLLPDGGTMRVIHYQTPMAADSVTVRGKRIGKIDGLGLLDDGTLCIMELKAPAERMAGDSPLKAMLEGLSYAAVEEKFHEEFLADIATLAAKPGAAHERFSGATIGRPTVLVLGPTSWWNMWENYEKQGLGQWKANLRQLSERLEECDLPKIRFASVQVDLRDLSRGTLDLAPRLTPPIVLADVEGLPGL